MEKGGGDRYGKCNRGNEAEGGRGRKEKVDGSENPVSLPPEFQDWRDVIKPSFLQ